MAALATSRTLAVAAASRHGGTCEIADRLASTLAAELPVGWSVVRAEVSDLQVFDDADAVVLGSAIYYGHWMHSAARALTHVKDAPLVGLWLFSSGPLSEAEGEDTHVPSADAMVTSGQADEHMVFGGRLDTTHLSWIERTAVKAAHAVPGDLRHWDEVDEWATHIAGQLTVVSAR